MSDSDTGEDEIFASIKRYQSQCVNCQRFYQLLHVWCFSCNIGTCYACSHVYCRHCDAAKCTRCQLCHRCIRDSDEDYTYSSGSDTDNSDIDDNINTEDITSIVL